MSDKTIVIIILPIILSIIINDHIIEILPG